MSSDVYLKDNLLKVFDSATDDRGCVKYCWHERDSAGLLLEKENLVFSMMGDYGDALQAVSTITSLYFKAGRADDVVSAVSDGLRRGAKYDTKELKI